MLPGADISVTRAIVCIAWIIGVFGPAAYYRFWPIGSLRPDHWLRFDRDLSVLSIRGGWSILRYEEIQCFLAVTIFERGKLSSKLLRALMQPMRNT